MKERDYIIATSLAKVRLMRVMLREAVFPGPTLTAYIPEVEMMRMHQALSDWEDRLAAQVTVQ